ncbi:hypothetical protein FE257_002397 [Aspergillus nanangensis]|uniref:AB hydrolase-1 domain-containing protein n=1 Tax=Aspergillus nanangensis TaxID=2582783 RepID=A0AAD4GNB8_ASPNN|nr:hypothetical protein FE257_002397 [Aspergillus nanangensis]
MVFLAHHGYRVIAHNRRGHGRSTQTWEGNNSNSDQFSDDLNELFAHLNVKDAMMVGHSHGGGEVTRYLGRHGTKRVKKAVLIGAVPPFMLKAAANPEGTDKSVFHSFRQGMHEDRSQFFLDIPTGPFFNFNKPGVKKSEGQIQNWWRQGMTEDLKKIDIPVLVRDQVVPFKASGQKSSKLLPQGKLKVYPGGSHAIHCTNIDEVNKDLLNFLQS